MKCDKCGHENPKQASFCEQCGNKLVIENREEKKNEPTNVEDAKRIKIGLIFVAIVFAIVCIFLVVQNVKRPKINLNKYLIITEKGYDGTGSISIDIDEEKLYQDYGSNLTWSDSATANAYAFFISNSPIEYICDEVKIKVDEDENKNLCNGDSVTYSWEVEKEQIESVVNCRIRYTDASYTLTSLEETGTFDAFNGVEIVTTGVAPQGEATIYYTGQYPIGNFFTMDQSTNLSNGDIVTVTLSMDDEDNFVKEYGVVPETYTKEYKISGMDMYITSASQINETDKAAYKSQADDVVTAYCANLGSNYIVDASTYLGEYFLTAKDKDNAEQNRYGLVYRISYHQDYEGETDSDTEYYYVEFSNIIADEEGVCEKQLSDYSASSGGFYSSTFESLSELKRKQVESEAADYNSEWNAAE